MEYNKEKRKKGIKKERKETRCSLNICKIQWNIIKKEKRKKERKKERKKGRKATRCSLNISKIQWNIIKKERKKGNQMQSEYL